MTPSRSIRVLHVVDSLDLGGAQTSLLNLLRATNRTRYEPQVACMHGRGVFWEQFTALEIPLHSLSPRKWLPLYVIRLIRLMRAQRFHIVHCHLFGSNWIAKPLAALFGVPVRVAHDHCNDALRYENPLALALDTFLNRWSSHICAVSASTRDFLLEREGLPAERVSLVYNGIDLHRFSRPVERPPHKRFVVLGVGRLHAQKNFTLFLEVAAELLRRGRDVTFRIAGTGPEEQALRAQAAELGMERHVEFVGHVVEMPRLYAEADALLMTSRYEGTPVSALEAMAMRVPIIAPRLDGLAEMLTDGEDALLSAPNDRDGFVLQLEQIMTSPHLAARLADAAERKVHARYSAATMAAQVETIYERCLAPDVRSAA